MHFFRSEEHLRNWSDFKPENEGGIISLTDLVKWFSMDYVRKRLDPDFFSNMQKYFEDWVNKLKDIGKTGDFWLP